MRALREAGCRPDARNNCGLTPIDIFVAVLAVDESWSKFLSTPCEGSLQNGLSRIQNTLALLDTRGKADLRTAVTQHSHWLTSPQASLNLVEQRVEAEKSAYKQLMHLSNGRETDKFTDTEFLSDDSSIFTDENNPTVGVLGQPQMWQRLDEIYLNMSLQIAASSIQQEANIIQGEVGDCYFMSDLSIVLGGTLSPEQLVIGNFTAGVFFARFYMSGRWRWYTVDSKMPCRQAKDGIRFYLIYAENKDASLAWGEGESAQPISCWLPVYQKAYAKAHGCYELTDGGFGKLAMVDIQGGYSKSISHPTKGLECAELSPMPSVVQIKVYLGIACPK